MPTWIIEQELTAPLADRTAPPGLTRAAVLVRHEGHPLGQTWVPLRDGVLTADDLRAALVSDHALIARLTQRAVREWLLHPREGAEGRPAHRGAAPEALPSWSVVVCTRERPDDLRRCLASLLALRAPAGEILVVDNAPRTSATLEVVAGLADADSPHRLRYLREDRPGQNWARAAGARAATGEIVAYTDDDVVVDAGWIMGLLPEFVGDRTIGAVTGPAPALELDTEAQELFESRGFVRGWDRRVFDATTLRPMQGSSVGAGANVAFRRELLLQLRPFSHEQDGGTVTMSAGDTYAFYLVLAHGWRIVYTPEALVWHRHRRDVAAVAEQLRGYSVGGLTMLLRCLLEHREFEVPRVIWEWIRYDHVRQLGRLVLRRPTAMPALVVREYWRGLFEAPAAYLRARRRERRLLAEDRAARVRDFAPVAAAEVPLRPVEALAAAAARHDVPVATAAGVGLADARPPEPPPGQPPRGGRLAPADAAAP